MTETKRRVPVLIVEDDADLATGLVAEFHKNNNLPDFTYLFSAEIASSSDESIEMLKSHTYDVVILDVKLPGGREGLDLNLSMALWEEFGPDKPIRIVMTAKESIRDCVEAMRNRAWDYIPKKFETRRTFHRIVFDSAVAALRHQDVRLEQERIIDQWLEEHLGELQDQYHAGLVALWCEQTVQVLAHGMDAFDLERALGPWRAQKSTGEARPSCEQPYILSIPSELV